MLFLELGVQFCVELPDGGVATLQQLLVHRLLVHHARQVTLACPASKQNITHTLLMIIHYTRKRDYSLIIFYLAIGF